MVVTCVNSIEDCTIDGDSKGLSGQTLDHNVEGLTASRDLKINNIRLHKTMPFQNVAGHHSIHQHNLVTHLHAHSGCRRSRLHSRNLRKGVDGSAHSSQVTATPHL
jgi:hypothetical protein